MRFVTPVGKNRRKFFEAAAAGNAPRRRQRAAPKLAFCATSAVCLTPMALCMLKKQPIPTALYFMSHPEQAAATCRTGGERPAAQDRFLYSNHPLSYPDGTVYA